MNGLIKVTAIKGYYEKGKIITKEDASVQSKIDVIITFLADDNTTKSKRIPGGMKGRISIPNGFNEH